MALAVAASTIAVGQPVESLVLRCDGKIATIAGTRGHDVIEGTPDADVIVGLGGNDRIAGLGGDDVICGGRGDDTLTGGPGDDVLHGGAGTDALAGSSGDDDLYGGQAADSLRGGRGHDRLFGGAGDDELRGGPGLDHLDPGPGSPSCIDQHENEWCATTSTGFAIAARPSETFGSDGAVLRLRVEVEAATGIDPVTVGDQVDRILADPRGWTTGDRRFRRVTGDAEVRVVVATPNSVDRACAPLRTNGWLSCRSRSTLWLNADRWTGAVAHWTSSLDEYRAYLLNHELGHALGYGHVGCPAAGAPAPVMMQQTKSVGSCEPNGWPFPSG